MIHWSCPSCGATSYGQGFNRVWQFCWCGWRISNIQLSPPYVKFTYGSVTESETEKTFNPVNRRVTLSEYVEGLIRDATAFESWYRVRFGQDEMNRADWLEQFLNFLEDHNDAT
jgi:hypothetical protein